MAAGPAGSAVQRALIGTYAAARRAGVMSNPLGERAFVSAYFLYKRLLEDPYARLARECPALFRGGHIVDVGANVGYCAVLFSRLVDPGCRVLAFEPDRRNFGMLQRVSRRHRAITPIAMAAGDRSGAADFWSNPRHHGDSRTVTEDLRGAIDIRDTYAVPSIRIDEYLRTHHRGEPVAFVKVDVQGYEEPVCRGLSETLDRHEALSLAFEFMPAAIRESGFTPSGLVGFLAQRGLRFYLLARDARPVAVAPDQLESIAGTTGYCDVLARRSSAGLAGTAAAR